MKMKIPRSKMLIALTFCAMGQVQAAEQYWFGDTTGIEWYPTGKNITYTKSDSRINPVLTAHSLKMDQGIFKIGKNAYTAHGYGLTSTAFIVGPTGILVIDPPEDVNKGKIALEAFRKHSKITKPIAGVMYSHWHVDHYAGVKGFVSAEDVKSGKVKIIAHKTFMDALIGSSAGGDGPIIGARVDYSLGTLLELGPEGRINGGLGPDFEALDLSLIPPTVLVDKQIEVEVGGMKVHFEHIPSEASDEIMAWFPELGLLHVAEAIQGESFPNLHSIRGTKYREPERWFKSIDAMRRFPAKFMIPSHGRPVSGEKAVAEVLASYRDAIQYVFDQTIRNMNMGMLPDELVRAVKLPPKLENHPWLGDFYGGVKHSVRQIYSGQLGWFEGDPTFLDPLSRVDSSKRYVTLMGGRDKIFELAKTSTQSGDHQWSAELLTHIIRVDTQDMEARKLKAKNLREIGFTLTNNNWRNWYMTSALELENKLDYSKAIQLQSPDLVKEFPLAKIIESLRFKIDGSKAASALMVVGLNITGAKTGNFTLTVRNGVLQFEEKSAKNADLAMTIDYKAFMQLVASSSTPPAPGGDGATVAVPMDTFNKAIMGGSIKLDKGSPDELEKFLSYFEGPVKKKFPITIK
jgi:alkyl sulfatase BDS1-like metallo-beta-lactamase superfamily hydrolase